MQIMKGATLVLIGLFCLLVSCKDQEVSTGKSDGIQLKNVTLRHIDPTDININAKPLKLRRCLPEAPQADKAPAPPLALSGRLGLWVSEIDPRTMNIIRAVSINPDETFPLASTYKQAVLWATLREYDAKRLKPTDRFDVTRSNQSLGTYPYDGSTVRQLSEVMISRSDNTATDILHRRVGLQKVQGLADYLGLCNTRLIMPTRNWWVMQAGLSETFNKNPNWFANTKEQRELLATKIDQEASEYRSDYLSRKLDYYFVNKYNLSDDLKVHNLSTPYELSIMLAYQHLRSGLSKKAQQWQRNVLSKGYGRYALKLHQANKVKYFGGKGGNGWRILTYSGYIETKDGRHLVYAFMQHGAAETYTMPNTRRAFAWINKGIDAVLAP